MNKFVALCKRILTKELLLYIVFGILAALVSMLTFFLFNSVIGLHYALSNILSWVITVTFAYLTNKFAVFHVTGVRRWKLFLEIMLFYAARLFSLAIEEAGLFLLIDWAHLDELLSKAILQVVVVVLNYIFSKLIIFKKKKSEDASNEQNSGTDSMLQ